MKLNVVIISSIIHTPSNPLSYTTTRSVFSFQDRFEQTKQTIKSIKDKIPNVFIILIECSSLSECMENYLTQHTDVFLNIYSNVEARKYIYSPSKSLGESTQIKHALHYIKDKMDITTISNIFKLSGRYWLSDSFSYDMFDNDKWVIKSIRNDPKKDNILTALYKLPINGLQQYLTSIINSKSDYDKCVGLEYVFAKFILEIPENNKIFVTKIGFEGYISINGVKYEG